MSLSGKIGRRLGQWAFQARKRLNLLPDRTGDARARFGVYVAYYDASQVYATHLESIRRNTTQPFNYYVTRNCTSGEECAAFDRLVRRYGFPTVFKPWPASVALTHGESLQRMIDMTRDEIIVLCDVDAFPIRRGWDEFVLEELRTREIVAVPAHIPSRKPLSLFLHPCFMAFRREFLDRNGLDVLPGEGNDPAYRLTTHLMAAGHFDESHVTALFPTRREIVVPCSLPDTELFGRSDLIHGFGTTYADLIFHFWWVRHMSSLRPIHNDDGQVVVTPAQISEVIERINRTYGPADAGAGD